MSPKPQKKSDLDKGWMKKRQDRNIRIRPEYHLIVTEGTRTEPKYFGAIKKIIDEQYPEKIHMEVIGSGVNTTDLVKRAETLARQNPNGYKHVWIVFDTDDFPAERVNRTEEMCRNNTTEETAYHAAWSNQCFELWFLLHFGYFQSNIHRKEYEPKLSQYLTEAGRGEYDKDRADMYDVLRPYMDRAISHAKRLDKRNAGKPPFSAAPGTKVYELIEMLKPYL